MTSCCWSVVTAVPREPKASVAEAVVGAVFASDAAGLLGAAVVDFWQRYPPFGHWVDFEG